MVSNQYHAAISIFSSKTDKAAFLKTALTDCPGLPVMMGGYGRFYYSGRFRRFRRYGRFLVTPEFSAVLLRFCHPLCVKNKILKVDPSYAWTPSKQLSEETFLLSTEADDRRQQEEEKEFNFITEIFFLTQKSLDLGLRVCHEKFVKMNQELGRHQQVYRESMAQQGTSAAEAVQQRMDVIMTKYLSLKAALLVPSATDNTLSLCASTGSWLTQIALNKISIDNQQSF